MNKRLLYLALLLFILISCEKTSNQDLFLKYYGDAYEDIGYSVSKTREGYMITGQYTVLKRENTNRGSSITGSAKRMIVLQTDEQGNETGKLITGGKFTSSGTKLITFDDGKAIVIGYVVDSVTLKRDIYIVKIAAGNEGFTEKIFRNPGDQAGIDIIKKENGYLILGTTDTGAESTGNIEGKTDILLIETDDNLNEISRIARGFPGNDDPSAIKKYGTNGYMIVGTTDRSDADYAGQAGRNIFLLPVNDNAVPTEFRIIGGADDESAADIEVLTDGFMVAGTIGKDGAQQAGYFWKMPANIYNEPEAEGRISLGQDSPDSFSVCSMCKYRASSFILAGRYGAGTSSDMLVFAMDANGNYIRGLKKIPEGTGVQIAYDVLTDGEDIVAVGKNTYENNSMITLLKFRF
jgi:hypothetical protein